MTDNINPTLIKINSLLKERNWSYYKLAKEADIPYSSINSMFQKNTQPSLATLEKLCDGLHITLSEFFSDAPPYREQSYMYSDDEIAMIKLYRSLNYSERKILMAYIKGFCHERL